MAARIYKPAKTAMQSGLANTKAWVLDLRDTGLIDQFGLTRAEGDVAQHLAHLRAPTVIARELGLSVNTVRTHIRRIYAKLSINSQMQFERLVHTFTWA